jgi:hypothetical protein
VSSVPKADFYVHCARFENLRLPLLSPALLETCNRRQGHLLPYSGYAQSRPIPNARIHLPVVPMDATRRASILSAILSLSLSFSELSSETGELSLARADCLPHLP